MPAAQAGITSVYQQRGHFATLISWFSDWQAHDWRSRLRPDASTPSAVSGSRLDTPHLETAPRGELAL